MIEKDDQERDPQPVFSAAELDAITQHLDSWSSITESLSGFEPHKISIDSEGWFRQQGWIFRGVRCSCYRLKPTIERQSNGEYSWATIEHVLLDLFRKQAKLHLNVRDIPADDDRLSWLALMQHHGVPTRLLDFSFSPWVALYFAVRIPGSESPTDDAALWGINREKLADAAAEVNRKWAQRERQANRTRRKGRVVSSHPDSFALEFDTFRYEYDDQDRVAKSALDAEPARRRVYHEEGFVTPAASPARNHRLSVQQGVFAFNGAEEMQFEHSLKKMMGAPSQDWIRRFIIPQRMVEDVRKRLYMMNIHELSLFPDAGGLAEFLVQDVRYKLGQ